MLLTQDVTAQECFIPLDKLVQLFPAVTEGEAPRLLTGLSDPSQSVRFSDEEARNAFQGIVDTLVGNQNSESEEAILLECPCCIGELPVDQFVSCRSGEHWYFAECVKKYTEALLFGSGQLGAKRSMDYLELACIAEECLSTYCQSSI